jgi:hypothetical protein
MRLLCTLAISAWVTIGIASSASADALFMGLGDLPGRYFLSIAYEISAGGSI